MSSLEIPYLIEPLTTSDTSEWTRITNSAFAGPLDCIFRAHPYSPTDSYSPDTLSKWNAQKLKSLENPNAWNLKVIDTSTNAIVGVAQWVVWPVERTIDEVNSMFVKPEQFPEFNYEGLVTWREFKWDIRRRAIGMRPHVCLETLTIDPAYQRKGLGTLLMREGIQRAEKMGLPCYMEAGAHGRGLYTKLGFEDVLQEKFDLRKWGGEVEIVGTCMIREPPGKGEGNEETAGCASA